MCCVIGGLCDLPRGTGVTIVFEIEDENGNPETFASFADVHIKLQVGYRDVAFFSTDAAYSDRDGEVLAVSGQPTFCQIHIPPSLSINFPLGLLEADFMKVYTDTDYPDNERPVIEKVQLRTVKDSSIGEKIYG